jgi:hypothetical protein
MGVTMMKVAEYFFHNRDEFITAKEMVQEKLH